MEVPPRVVTEVTAAPGLPAQPGPQALRVQRLQVILYPAHRVLLAQRVRPGVAVVEAAQAEASN